MKVKVTQISLHSKEEIEIDFDYEISGKVISFSFCGLAMINTKQCPIKQLKREGWKFNTFEHQYYISPEEITRIIDECQAKSRGTDTDRFLDPHGT
jgi:frataxin-like iron-binding protein CyaY